MAAKAASAIVGCASGGAHLAVYSLGLLPGPALPEITAPSGGVLRRQLCSCSSDKRGHTANVATNIPVETTA